MNLYELTQEGLELSELLENDELTPELEQRLCFSQNEVQSKGCFLAPIMLNNEIAIDAIDNQIKRLKELKDKKERAINRTKNALKIAMLANGIDKIESPLFKLTLRRSESVEVDIVEALPSQFLNVKNVVTADKVAIKDAIKRGENVFGARIVENFNLQIK
jgi:hypothetical protein